MIFGLCILTCTHCKFLGPQWIFEFCNYYTVDQLFVLCILLHPLNTRTWKVPTAIECFNLCTRIHALIECVCISTHQQRRTPICILQGTCFQSHCYCLCFLVKYLCLNVYVRIVSNYYRAEQWGTIVWMLQVTRSLPVACAGLLKTKMPPNQIVVSIICFINAAAILVLNMFFFIVVYFIECISPKERIMITQPPLWGCGK